jgi:hypothetical protein
LKGDIEKWYLDFENQTRRRPRAGDCPPEVIKKLERFNALNQSYSRIKYSLQKQGIVRKELGNFKGDKKGGNRKPDPKSKKNDMKNLGKPPSGRPEEEDGYDQAALERTALEAEVDLLREQIHSKDNFNTNLNDEIL